MASKRALALGVFLAAALGAAIAAGAPGRGAEAAGIAVSNLVEREVIVVDNTGRRQLRRAPAARVVPGEEVIFTARYVNTGRDWVDKVVITNPVPAHMVYSAGSAEAPGVTAIFSVDGGRSFDVPERLVVTGRDGKRRPARPSEYTHVRWVLDRGLPPGGEGRVAFRAVLR